MQLSGTLASISFTSEGRYKVFVVKTHCFIPAIIRFFVGSVSMELLLSQLTDFLNYCFYYHQKFCNYQIDDHGITGVQQAASLVCG